MVGGMEQWLVDRIRSESVCQQLFSHVTVGGPDGCWIWTAALTRDRHGLIKIGGKKGRCIHAHRVSFIMHGGDPATPVIRHACDNPACQNPRHLIGGTHAENVADRVSRGRSAVGERNGRSKLKSDDIPVIRQMLATGQSAYSIARLYGVDAKVIREIRDGKKWKCVPTLSTLSLVA